MGITADNAKFLFYAKTMGVSYEHTLMLGRLKLDAKKSDLEKFSNYFKNNSKKVGEVAFKDSFAEPLFELLGALHTDSLDISDYEKASILHDLNTPIPASLKNKFSAVADGGTIEHIFNFPVAIKNCMEALKVGGHYISFTPANNTFGHGFYQFSPELFYRIFSADNGFRVKLIAAYQEEGGAWYAVADPEAIKSRVILINSVPTHLIVLAEKIAVKEIFSIVPQQSDYQYAWNLHQSIKQNKRFEKDSMLLHLYKKMIPAQARILLRNIYDSLFKKPEDIPGLGQVNPAYFKKIEVGI